MVGIFGYIGKFVIILCRYVDVMGFLGDISSRYCSMLKNNIPLDKPENTTYVIYGLL